ncbi:DUF4382 domain-containing protein [Gemmatimonadota bacterium]
MHFRKISGSLGVLAVAITLSFSACSTEPSGTGTLQLNLVDAPTPIEGIEAIDIVFSFISVHASADADSENVGWIIVMDDQTIEEERTFNLLEYVNGTSAILGEAELEEGHYTQLRIGIESASITINGTTSDLTIPSGTQSGLKLTGGFNIDPNVITAITLDFDAGESVRENPPGSGRYKLQPTIRMIETILSGTISGTVTPDTLRTLVTAYEQGTTTVVTSTYADTLTGGYMLQALLAGTYDLEASAEGYDVATEAGVTVTAGQDNPDHDFILTESTGGGGGGGGLQ